MNKVTRVLVAIAAALPAACGYARVQVPASLSPLPTPDAAAPLRAGFARVDITPPPGVGLAGYATEGARASGYRLRLYARVLVLADAGGNRLAIVVADLALNSILLQRRVAAITAAQDGIGVDRLVIAVTHTHAGPGHHFDAVAYNDQGSSVVGYDPLLVDSLSARIARAVHAAVAELRPARVAWGQQRLWGYTRIRSLPAMLRNIPPPVAPPDAPASLLPEYRLVDPELSMLRVDLLDPADGRYHPAGAFSIFAMHATGNSPVNDLLDPDIHGLVERRLERHIDRDLNRRSDSAFVPRAFHLFANGAEGDVSPAFPPQSRCSVPRLVELPALDGPFTRPQWVWQPPAATRVAACQHAARQAVEWIGAALGDSAIRLFDALGDALTDRLELARAFVAVPLRDSALALGICPTPAVGMAALAGAPDSYSRMEGMKLFGLLDVGLSEGSPNPDAAGCQADKRTVLDGLFGNLPNRLFVAGMVPAHAEFTVFRLGDRLIGTVPAEVTTTAGRRIRQAMLAAASTRGLPATSALILGITNGFMEYVTTPEEYTAQFYEGGSVLYGPGEAAMIARTLATLVSRLSSGDSLPASAAPGIRATVGHQRRIIPRPSSSPRPDPVVLRAWCSGDTLYARLRMGSVADWPVATGDVSLEPRVAIIEDVAGRPLVSWDDDPMFELRLADRHHGSATWELRWSGAGARRYRVVIGDRVQSDPVACQGTSR